MEEAKNQSHPIRGILLAICSMGSLWIGRLSNAQTVAGVVSGESTSTFGRLLGAFPMLNAEMLTHGFYVLAVALIVLGIYQFFELQINEVVKWYCGEPEVHAARRRNWIIALTFIGIGAYCMATTYGNPASVWLCALVGFAAFLGSLIFAYSRNAEAGVHLEALEAAKEEGKKAGLRAGREERNQRLEEEHEGELTKLMDKLATETEKRKAARESSEENRKRAESAEWEVEKAKRSLDEPVLAIEIFQYMAGGLDDKNAVRKAALRYWIDKQERLFEQKITSDEELKSWFSQTANLDNKIGRVSWIMLGPKTQLVDRRLPLLKNPPIDGSYNNNHNAERNRLSAMIEKMKSTLHELDAQTPTEKPPVNLDNPSKDESNDSK